MVDKLLAPIELTDAELDAVAAGQITQNPNIVQGVGLVNVGASVNVADVANNLSVLNNSLNNNSLDVAVAVLGTGIAA